MSFESDGEQEYPPRSFFGRFVNIILQPAYEWRIVESEGIKKEEVISNYVAPLLLICGLISSISHYLYANDHLPNANEYFIGISILFIFGIAISSAGILITSWLVNKLSVNFGGYEDALGSFKLSAYGMTSIILASLFSDVLNFLVFDRASDFGRAIATPVNIVLIFMAFYSVYTISKGAQFLLSVPKERSTSFSVALAFCMALAGLSYTFINYKFESILEDANMIPNRSVIAYEENERTQKMIEDTEELRRSIERMNESMRPSY